MSGTPSPTEIRRLIDDALEEIERTELEMLDLLSEMLGPERAQLIADYVASAQDQPRFDRLKTVEREVVSAVDAVAVHQLGESQPHQMAAEIPKPASDVTPGATPGPSTAPPATR